jgi:hypothetical protein
MTACPAPLVRTGAAFFRLTKILFLIGHHDDVRHEDRPLRTKPMDPELTGTSRKDRKAREDGQRDV